MKNKCLIMLLLCLLFAGRASAVEMRRPLSTQSPMYLFHIDVWNNADPQKIIDLVPEDFRPYVVFNISLSVSENVTKDGMRTAESWLRTCAENRVWAMIQPASGGHSWFSDYDFSVYRYFFENYPNLIGFNYCEQFWGFNEADGLHPFGDKSPTIADRMNLFTNLLDIADEFGGYLVISNCLVRPEWDSTSPLTMFKCYPEFAAKAKELKDHLIYCEKYTMSGNFYDMESMCFGVFMSDYCDNWGMRFDQCGYVEHVYTNIDGSKKMPPAIAGMTIMEHMMMTGQTVQDGPELIWNQCVQGLNDERLEDGFSARKWQLYPQFVNVYLDVWKKFTTDGVIRILGKQEVIDSTKIAIYNDIDPFKQSNNWEGRRSHKFLFSSLYALDEGTFQDDSVFLKKTGRYTTIPTIFIDNGKDLGFQRVIKQSRYSAVWRNSQAKVDDFNELFAPQTADDPATSLYVRRIDNNWLVYNNSQYEKQRKVETSTLDLRYNSCDAVTLTMPMYSFGLLTEKADGIDLYLNNYTHVKEQTTDVISIKGCASKPSFTVTERGKHDPSTVSSEYADGVFTLTVTHNGPLDIAVKCAGSNSDRESVPTFDKTFCDVVPPVYEGVRQYEFENADYVNVDKQYNGITRSDIPGFTALGYASLGNKSGAKLRDYVYIDKAGTYKVKVRYLSPDAEINRINVSVNGSVIARNVKFPQTDADNNWAVIEFDADFVQGKSEVMLYTTKAQTTPLYLDNFTLTPVGGTVGIDSILDDEEAVEPAEHRCYDIYGRPVSYDHLQKGHFYIIDGKKVIF